MKTFTFFVLLKALTITACFFMLPALPFITFSDATLNIASQTIIHKNVANYTTSPILFYKTQQSSQDIKLQKIDGDLLVIVDQDVDLVAHYYHFMEHLLGIWNFLLYDKREDVKQILFSFWDRKDKDHTWTGLNNVTYLLLTYIFPNAKINLITELPENVNIHAKNIHLSNRFLAENVPKVGNVNMNGPISSLYKPERIRELRDLVFNKMGVTMEAPTDHLRVTYVKRTKTRIMDPTLEETLLNAIAQETGQKPLVVDFSQMSFAEQLQIIANTDLLMGVHGNGLTHLIFLPDDAAVVEFHPGKNCAYYRTMAQIRGLQYYGNFNNEWTLKYNNSLENSRQNKDVTQINLSRIVTLIRTLNNKYHDS